LYQNAGLADAFQGHADSALAHLKHAYDLDSARFGNAAYLMFGYAVAGRWSDVDRVQAQIERGGGGNSPNFFKALIEIVNGHRGSAAAALERAFDRREPLLLFISAACEPTFDLIKTEPRYVALMKRNRMRV